jgi:PadR family transcriptional regulator, regulatory protein AphA
MALRYALLGLLAEKPASGYELAKAFEGELGRYAWQAGHNRIYPELARLTEESLIEVVAEGPRGRRTYALTKAGRTELRSWLLQPRTGGPVRSEYVLRLFLLSALDREDARKLLREVADRNAQEAAALREALALKAPMSPGGKLPFGWLAGGYGLRQYEAARDWAEWALDELDRTEVRADSEVSKPASR